MVDDHNSTSWRPLGEVAEIATGLLPRSQVGEDLPSVQVQHLDAHGIIRVPASDARRQRDPGVSRWCVAAGDVLIAGRTNSPTIRVGLVNPELEGVTFTSNLVRLRLRGGLLPEVLVAYLLSRDGQAKLARHCRGIALRHLTVRDLASMTVPVPCRPTQDRMALLWAAMQRSYTEAVAAAERRRDLGMFVLESAGWPELDGDPDAERGTPWPRG